MSENYINNQVFYKDLSEWIYSGRPRPIPEKLINYLKIIIYRISTKKNFCRYVFLDDMKSEAMLHCYNALYKYDARKDNPYGYFTTCVHHAFMQILKKEKKFVDFKFKLIQDEIDSSHRLDRNTIVSSNRNEGGDAVDENGRVLTEFKTLQRKGLH